MKGAPISGSPRAGGAVRFSDSAAAGAPLPRRESSAVTNFIQ